MTAWEKQLDGSQLPPTADAAVWAAPNGSGAWSVVSGTWQQRTVAQSQYFRALTMNTTDMTFDAMLKVISTAGSDPKWGCFLHMGSSVADAWAWHFFADRIQHSNTASAAVDAYVADMTAFRRVTIVKAGTTHELWVDNVLRFTKTGASANIPGVYFGGGSTNASASTDWQWFRYAKKALRPSWHDATPDAASGVSY